jgi:hypothetical protein
MHQYGPRAQDVLAEWLERRGFTPYTNNRDEEGWFTTGPQVEDFPADAGASMQLGRIYYRAPRLGIHYGRAQLHRASNLLTQLGVWWKPRRNDQGYFFLVVQVCPELDAELPVPEPTVEAVAEQEAQPTA